MSILQTFTEGRKALVATPARWLEYGPGARTLNRSPRQFDLFLSHRKIESVRVQALARTLSEKHGLRVWFDQWECGPGKLEPQCEVVKRTIVTGGRGWRAPARNPGASRGNSFDRSSSKLRGFLRSAQSSPGHPMDGAHTCAEYLHSGHGFLPGVLNISSRGQYTSVSTPALRFM